MQKMYKDLQIDNNNGIYRCNTAVRQRKRENRRDNQERTIQKQTTLATRHIASTQKTISSTHKAKKIRKKDEQLRPHQKRGVLNSGAGEGCECFLIRHQSCSVLLVVKSSKSFIGDRGKKQN